MSDGRVRVRIQIWPAIIEPGGFDYDGKHFMWMCPCCRWGQAWADTVGRADEHARVTHPAAVGVGCTQRETAR